MALVDDDFEAYPLGNISLPFGSWQGATFISQIVAGGPRGTGQCYRMFGQVYYDDGNFYDKGSIWFAMLSSRGCDGFFVVQHVAPSLAAHNWVSLRLEVDSTVSVFVNGVFSKNTLDPIDFAPWNFFQLNFTLDSVLVTGVLMVRVNYELAINGISLLTDTIVTNVPEASLSNGFASANTFKMQPNVTVQYDDVTVDSLHALPSFPHPGTPYARVSQGVVEVAELVNNAGTRITQGVAELQQLPDQALIRITQGVIELLITRGGRWYVHEA